MINYTIKSALIILIYSFLQKNIRLHTQPYFTPQVGLEPTTLWLTVRCYYQLSYCGKISKIKNGAGDENRTHNISLEDWGFTTKLHPHLLYIYLLRYLLYYIFYSLSITFLTFFYKLEIGANFLTSTSYYNSISL